MLNEIKGIGVSNYTRFVYEIFDTGHYHGV